MQTVPQLLGQLRDRQLKPADCLPQSNKPEACGFAARDLDCRWRPAMNTLVGTGRTRLVADSPAPPLRGIHDTSSAGIDPRHTLAEHLPNPAGTACSTCGFAYSKARPLCPSVARALRTMATRTDARSLSAYSTGQLRAMERNHCGTGRCRRCGFTYTPSARLCPTSRRIAIELESRFKAPMRETRAGQGMCSGKGVAWTVTGSESGPWRQAVAACAQCPLLAQCTADLERRLASGERVQDQILAGRLFSGKGVEIEPSGFDAYADRFGAKTKDRNYRPRRRPTRCTVVARTAPEPDPTLTAGDQLALFESVAA